MERIDACDRVGGLRGDGLEVPGGYVRADGLELLRALGTELVEEGREGGLIAPSLIQTTRAGGPGAATTVTNRRPRRQLFSSTLHAYHAVQDIAAAVPHDPALEDPTDAA